MFELSVSSDGRDTSQQFLEKLAAAEEGRAQSIWIANHLFLRDPISLSAVSLSHTKRMNVVLMAISPLTVHPVQAAMAAATLDEMFPGRVTLCFGVGAPADLNALSIDGSKPLKMAREALKLTKALFRGETVHFEGEHFSILSRSLVTGARNVPIVLAASGPGMLELAGAEADGVLISAGASMQFVEQTLDHVRRGAKGRRVRAHGLVYSSVDDDEKKANDRLRRVLAILLRGSHHKANLDVAGSKLDQSKLNEAVLANDWKTAELLITDDIVRHHTASGSPQQLNECFEAYHRAGLDNIIIAGVRDAEQVSRILKIGRKQS
ncbi:MAG: LLM class flavin-dependent oxidoreductase [Xanthobacteraceae bacterium]|nr:LLM class flavin-dependent oxidoreductase [Xanthobacteraceae bacterium]QYK45659.1 MAG: LLM class flavin-dependent oxidoreductase [Xanthobacteraceae bacterium]